MFHSAYVLEKVLPSLVSCRLSCQKTRNPPLDLCKIAEHAWETPWCMGSDEYGRTIMSANLHDE